MLPETPRFGYSIVKKEAGKDFPKAVLFIPKDGTVPVSGLRIHDIRITPLNPEKTGEQTIIDSMMLTVPEQSPQFLNGVHRIFFPERHLIRAGAFHLANKVHFLLARPGTMEIQKIDQGIVVYCENVITEVAYGDEWWPEIEEVQIAQAKLRARNLQNY